MRYRIGCDGISIYDLAVDTKRYYLNPAGQHPTSVAVVSLILISEIVTVHIVELIILDKFSSLFHFFLIELFPLGISSLGN